MKNQTILAIETSCDETSAAVIVNGKIKSNIIASQAKLHAQFGGVVPEVAAREHVTAIIPTIELALKTSDTKLTGLDCIAVTQGPGLATSLMVGVDTAKALGAALEIPVIPINHLGAHIYANFVDRKINFPAIALIVSGGHTLLVEMKNHAQYRILGETVDDAAGEAFDKTAKMLGLGYPGGPQLSKLAEKGNPKAFDFPRPMIHSGNFEFSFSGLKTAVLYEIRDQKSKIGKQKANIAASIQQAIVDVLIAKLEKSIQRYKPKTILLGGGVAANRLLRENFKLLSKKYKLDSSIPPFEYCTDNAAMIGVAAYYRLKNNKASFKNFSVNPNLNLK
jgi:N6-L-threonylcarbamoyladenine synthase